MLVVLFSPTIRKLVVGKFYLFQINLTYSKTVDFVQMASFDDYKKNLAGYVGQLVECSPSMQEALGSSTQVSIITSAGCNGLSWRWKLKNHKFTVTNWRPIGAM